MVLKNVNRELFMCLELRGRSDRFFLTLFIGFFISWYAINKCCAVCVIASKQLHVDSRKIL